MPRDVFISYSSKDKTAAGATRNVLESRGIKCWIAPRDIAAGKEWSEAIVEAIEACKVMVLVFSDNANQSIQVKQEVERAVNKGKILIPLRIEDVPPSKSLELFLGLRHWIDALTPPVEVHLQGLADDVENRLGVASGPGRPPSAPQTSWRGSRRRLLLVAIALVLAAGGVFFAVRRHDPPPPPPSQFEAGRRLYLGTGGPRDVPGAIALWRRAAEAGDARASAALGDRYVYGQGIERRDPAQAVEWYEMARKANANGPTALHGLGMMYEYGRGKLKADTRKADDLYRKAAAALQAAVAADPADTAAMIHLGQMFYYGVGGLPKDRRKAFDYYEQAAKARDPLGMASVGGLYENGEGGLAKDPDEAVTWFRKAADLGDEYGGGRVGSGRMIPGGIPVEPVGRAGSDCRPGPTIIPARSELEDVQGKRRVDHPAAVTVGGHPRRAGGQSGRGGQGDGDG